MGKHYKGSIGTPMSNTRDPNNPSYDPAVKGGDLDDAISKIFASGEHLTGWERAFLESVYGLSGLTDKQASSVGSIYARATGKTLKPAKKPKRRHKVKAERRRTWGGGGNNSMRELNLKLVEQTIKELRESSRGRKVWRVQDKVTKACSMQFAEWEEREAKKWFEDNLKSFPEYFSSRELKLVNMKTDSERLMKRAATMLAGFMARDRKELS